MSTLLQRLTTPSRLAAHHNCRWFSVFSQLRSNGNPLEQVPRKSEDSAWDAFSSMVNGSDKTTGFLKEDNLPPAEYWAKRSENLLKTLPPPQSMLTGRTVACIDGNVGQAYSKLTARNTRNRVYQEWRAQQRHTRRGEARRQLESQRWRRLFGHEVRKKVQVVDAIRRRRSS